MCVLVSLKPFKTHTAQWIWTCPEDRDDFIITSPCSARGLIKNMWLHSFCTLQIDWVSNVFPLLGDVRVCAQAGFVLLSWIFSSLSGFWPHLSFIWLVSACSSGFGQKGSRPAELDGIIHVASCVRVCYAQWQQMKSIWLTVFLRNHTAQFCFDFVTPDRAMLAVSPRCQFLC